MTSFSTTLATPKSVVTNSNNTLSCTPNPPTGQGFAALNCNYVNDLKCAEFTVDNTGSGSNHLVGIGYGITGMDFSSSTHRVGSDSVSWGYYVIPQTGKSYIQHNGATIYEGDMLAAGDVVQLYADSVNGFVYLAKNGTFMKNSLGDVGDPSSGALGTGSMFSFPTGQADNYIVGITNNMSISSQLTFNNPPTLPIVTGYTAV